MTISIADYEIVKILLGERVKQVEQLKQQNADLVAALEKVKMDIEFESLGLGDLKKQIKQALGGE